VAPRSDVQTAVSRIRQAEVGEEAANLLLASSRNELARLLQVTPKAVVAGDQLPAAVVALMSSPLGAQIDAHPDVRVATAQVKEQKGVARQALAQLSPTLSVQYRHYYNGQEFVTDPTADEPQIVAQYPFGNSFSALQRSKSEHTKVDSVAARLESTRHDVEATLRLTRAQLASSARSFRLQQDAASNAQSLVESFLRQYQAGRRSWVEVLNAQREAHEIQLGLIASRRSYLLSGQQLVLQSMAWDLLTNPQPR
jgi:adhesin transport system outer membrane protein